MPIRSTTKWRLLAKITNVYLAVSIIMHRAILSFILVTEDENVDSFVLYLDNVQCERVCSLWGNPTSYNSIFHDILPFICLT